MYPRRWLIALGLLGFLVGTLALFPARLVAAALPWPAYSMQAPQEVSGTIWAGSALLATRRETVRLSWSVNGWALLLARLQANVHLSARDLDGEGVVRIGLAGREIQVARGTVGPSRLQALFAANPVTLDRPLELHDMGLVIANGAITSARGTLAWGEGTVRLQSGESPSLPALRGRLSTGADGRLRLDVDSERAPGETLATADADPQLRKVHVALRQRAFDLTGKVPAGGKHGPDDVVFEVRQPLR